MPCKTPVKIRVPKPLPNKASLNKYAKIGVAAKRPTSKWETCWAASYLSCLFTTKVVPTTSTRATPRGTPI